MSAAGSTALTKAEAGTVSPVQTGQGGVTPQLTPQYFQGFDGAAVAPFPDEARKVLAEQVDPRDVEIKPDGIVFLPGVAWRRILTRAFGAGGWAIVPRTPARVMGNLVIYHGALVALGRFVSEAVGECFYREGNANMSYASCIEGARTDCVGRCARDLGYAAELWDANWREQWKAKYAVSYRGKKWDAKKQCEVEATLWRLKDRVSNPHDLMAGAGGVAPPAATPAPAPSSPATEAPSSTAPGAATFSPSPTSEVPDTGEIATDEQREAIKARLGAMAPKWKVTFMREWFRMHFGITTQEPARILEALSQEQADAAFLLLNAFGNQALYDKLLAELREKGTVRA